MRGRGVVAPLALRYLRMSGNGAWFDGGAIGRGVIGGADVFDGGA
jgi:hypothetical protein